MSRVVLLFPGQGAQSVGMAGGLVSRSEKAREYFDRAFRILGYDLLNLCVKGPESELNATRHCQPALFVHSMAALSDLLERKPDLFESVVAVAGLSLGEYSAACAAGAIGFEECLRLVQERGAAMQDAADLTPSGMASVLGLELSKVEAICNEGRQANEILQVANLLCPGNIAISGHRASIEAAKTSAESAGAMKYIPLSVAGAFHTPLMAPAMERLSNAIASTPISEARFPIYSNVDAQAHTNPEELKQLFPKQLVSPVLWEASLRNLVSLGIDQFYEIGAGRVLAGTLKRIDRKAVCECIGD